MKTSYRVVPIADPKPRVLDTEAEAHAAVYELRRTNRGYYLYQVTEEDGRRHVRFLSGWNPKV